jgi:WD40 repeat protein
VTDTFAHAPTHGPTSSAEMAARFDPLRDVLVPTAGESESARYEFGEVFARGGLGQIRRGFDRVLGRTIAIKETLAPGGVERFTREAQVTARLDHPAIVPVHDLGVHADGRPYYCMKLIDGRSLEEVIAGTRGLGERLLLLPNIVTVGEAVAFAHDRGVLHRDLKPANILIGNFGETWIIDWGLTGYLESTDPDPPAAVDRARAHLTQTGEWLGTLPYMAPEQRAGRRIDQRADVYGLGAVLYHTLSGSRPYADIPGDRLDEHVLRSAPTGLERLAPEVPPDLLTIVARAMARDPDARYPDVRTLVEELRRFLAGRLVAAHTYGLRETVRRWARRHRSVLAVASLAVVALTAMGLYSVLRITDERNTAVRNEALARDHQQAAESARDEAQRRDAEAREALATMWEAEGRRQLLEERRPLDAQGPLAQAVELAPDRSHLRTMLAHASAPLSAIGCDIDVYTPEVLAVHPHRPLAAFASERRARIELWDLERCAMVDEWLLGSPVVSVGFSADGTELRGLTQTRTLALTQLELARLPLRPGAVPSYTPVPVTYDRGRFDGSADRLFLGRADGRTSLSAWMHVLATEPPRTIEVPARRPRVSPDGTRISWLDRGRVHTRDDKNKNTTIARPVGDARRLLAVNDDGDALLATEEHLEILRADGSARPLERCGDRMMTGAAGVFHGNAGVLIVDDSAGELRVWDSQTGRCIGSVSGRRVVKWRLVAVSGESILVTLDGDMRLSFWRPGRAGLRHLTTLNCHASGIWDFDIQSTTSSLVTLGRDASMRVWDLTRLVDAPLVLHAPRIALSPAGTTAAATTDDGVDLVDLTAPDQLVARWSLSGLDALGWDSEGTLSARSGTRVYAWEPTLAGDPEALEVGRLFAAEDLEHDAIEGTPLVVVSGALAEQAEDLSTYDLRVYDRSTGEWRGYPDTRSRTRRSAHSPVSADKTRLLLSDTGNLIDVHTLSRVRVLDKSAVFTPDGAGILDVTPREGLVLHGAATGVTLRVLDPDFRMPSRSRGGVRQESAAQGLARSYAAAVFSPAGDAFITGAGPSSATLWPGLDAASSVSLEGHRLPVYASLWSRDGGRVLTRGLDNVACLWDGHSGQQLAEFADVPLDALIALGSDLLAVQDAADRVTLVDLTTGHRLFALPVDGLVDLAFAADGRHLYIVEGVPGESMTLRGFDVHADAKP